MVDIGTKQATRRVAVASATVRFPSDVAATLQADGLRSAKGPVLDTAIIAGTLAVKRTHELIPFCHPLPIDHCSIEIRTAPRNRLIVHAQVRVQHRTGVEMEALTAASVAALTIYDMCKALSHDISIGPVRLMAKSGGRRNFKRGTRK